MQSQNETPVESQLARGAFDLRAGRRKDTGKLKLFLQIGVFLLLVLAVLVAIWVKVLSSVGSDDEIDESSVVADAALQREEAGDESLEKLQERKRLQMQKEEAERIRQAELARQQERQQAPPTQAKDQEQRTADSQERRGASRKSDKPTAAERRMMGGVLLQASNGSPGGRTGNASQGDEEPAGSGSDERASLTRLGGTRFASTQARLAPEGTYLLSRNTYARCALYTEIITENPALVECHLTDPLYSANGKTMLAAAGARLFGEQRVAIRPGQQQVFTAWTEMEVNNGDQPVRVQLDSLGAGPLGASGTKAWIDHHYKDRFGGAVVLSLIQDALQMLSNTTQESSDGYTINNSERNAESMAEKALDHSINIPPTGYILPGTVITVIVARDLDFSTVYQNR